MIAQVVAAGRGNGLDRGHQHVCLGVRQREATGGGAVAVRAHPELRCAPGLLLLVLQGVVLGLVDLGLGLELVGDPPGA
ncbi:hypothetical protein LT946_08175 [Aeromicrobium sp. zg-Y1379]|nr:hypothetical protein [Aeromicrobium wangtongii]MCD9198238.1 hypothetical protein [Aeromicrobium wangtongii]